MASLTLCVIVKNEEKYLKGCLESVKNIAEEIVVVDTGSSDSTIEIAKSFGAKVFNFEWVNDFSAARNFALNQATKDFILFLDADERLDENSIPELKRLILGNQKVGFYCTVKSYDTEGGKDYSLRYVRLFSNAQGIVFIGKVHEQIEPSLLQSGVILIQSKILINHFGYDVSKTEKQNKAKRNLFLLLEDYETNKHPYSAFRLAQNYEMLNDEENAIKYFKIASDSGKLERQYRALCFTSLASISYRNQKITEAEKYVHHSLKIDDKQPFAHLLASKISVRKGELIIAEERCKRAYMLNKEFFVKGHEFPLVVILDPEEIIYYGLIIALQNKSISNTRLYQTELFSYYHRPGSLTDAIKTSLLQKLFTNASFNSQEVEMMIRMVNYSNLGFFVLTLGNNPYKQQVLIIVENMLKKYPKSVELKKLFAKTLFELGRVEEAAYEMEKVCAEYDDEPTVFFYLITYYLKLGQEEKIKPIVLKLEKNFSNIPDVMTRVRTLKRKLLMLTTVPL